MKDTVSKMCLYTGSPRGSDSTSPQPSPRKRSSLPDVVDIVLEKVKSGATKKLDLGEFSGRAFAVDDQLEADTDQSCCSVKQEQTQQNKVGVETPNNGKRCCHKERQACERTDNTENIKPADLDSLTHCVRKSLASSLSGEYVTETNHQFLSAQSDTTTTNLRPVAKVTYDLIYPQIVESVHTEPCCTHAPETNSLPLISSETEGTDRPCPGPQAVICEPAEDLQPSDVRELNESKSLPAPEQYGSQSQCCITVTGWEGEDLYPRPSDASDSSHTSAVQTCGESFNEDKCRFLNPLMGQGRGLVPNNLQQVNSFELEEVHSAGEEDFGQPVTTKTSYLLSKKQQDKGEVVRSDSVQSDSSGYADEDVSLSFNTHCR